MVMDVVGAVAIYNEAVLDLLSGGRKELEVRAPEISPHSSGWTFLTWRRRMRTLCSLQRNVLRHRVLSLFIAFALSFFLPR